MKPAANANEKEKKMAKKIETREWLNATGRDGYRRVERLGWTRLARIFRQNKPNGPERKLILAEARRLGYTPTVILAING
jgi:hypothetical protein